ncbi:hypothetical protein [Tepidiphilus margaritifer]|jgi:hypothetical protein|uniref:hypothetical protein n=1 Tax=Tepidiphilus margaritifer TaxID=203471 RepID=UPI0003F92CE2|nr:hypothetical protein [Tepidiphilus margaritifer]
MLATALCLVGCSSSPEGDPALATVRQLFSGPPAYAPKPLPYDSLVLRRSDGALWAQAVLGRVEPQTASLYWFVGGQSVRTSAVRLTKATDTAFDFILEPVSLEHWRFDPIRQACLTGQAQHREDWLDYPAEDLWSLHRLSDVAPRASADAPIEETFSVPLLKWQGTNRYWLDAACRPRRALVWLHPKQPAWELRWLKAGERP